MTAIYTHASGAENGPGGNSVDFPSTTYTTLVLLVTVSALSGSQPEATFAIDTKDAAGNYYQLWASPVIDRENDVVRISIGPGCEVPKAIGDSVRMRWNISDQGHGTDIPTATFYAQLLGK